MNTEEKQSAVISFRLHPSDEYERAALKIMHDLESKGFSKRQIFTDAINRSGGHRPEMFKQSEGVLTVGTLQHILADFARDLLTRLSASGIAAVSSEEQHRIDETATEYEQNLAAAYLARRNKRS